MTAHIDRRHLLDALKIVKPAIGSSATNPTLGCVRIVDGTLSATNLDLTITTKLEGSGLDQLDVLVPNAVFNRILAALTGAVVELDVEDRTLNIKSGRAEMAVLCADPYPWPQPQQVNGTPVAWSPAEVSLISRVLHAAANPAKSVVLSCVRIHNGAAEATDQHRLARAEFDTGDLDVLIPVAALTPVLDQAKGGVALTSSGNVAKLTADDTTWTFNLCAEKFPETARLWEIGKASPRSMTVAVAELMDAVRRSASLGSGDKLGVPKLTAEDGSLTIECRVTDVGETTDEIECTGEMDTTGFNPQFLLAMLDNLLEDEVTIHNEDGVKPVYVAEGAWSSLLMPIRNPK